MAYPSTFVDIRTTVLTTLRLDPVNDLAKVNDAINQSYAEAVVETDARVNFADMTLTAGTASYTFPSTPSRIISVYATPVGGYQTKPLRRITLDEMIAYRSAAAGPGANNGTVWAYVLLGLDDFELYPTPQNADTLRIYYTQTPTPLAADADTPILPEPYATNCLKYGALAKVAEYSGDPDGPYYQQLYAASVTELRAHLNRKSGRLTGQFQIQGGQALPAHDPSTDFRRF